MKHNRIHPKYIGQYMRIPLIPTCVVWLMLDRLQISGVLCGVLWTIWAVICIAVMMQPFYENWLHPAHLPTDK